MDIVNGELAQDRQQDNPQAYEGIARGSERDKAEAGEQEGEAEVNGSPISAEALEALERLRGDISPRALAERAYWERHPTSVKYVENIVLIDDVIDLTKRYGVWS